MHHGAIQERKGTNLCSYPKVPSTQISPYAPKTRATRQRYIYYTYSALGRLEIDTDVSQWAISPWVIGGPRSWSVYS